MFTNDQSTLMNKIVVIFQLTALCYGFTPFFYVYVFGMSFYITSSTKK